MKTATTEVLHQILYQPLQHRWNRASGSTGKISGGYKQMEISQRQHSRYLGPSDLLITAKSSILKVSW